MVYQPDLTTDAFTDGLAAEGLNGVRARYQDGKGPNPHPARAGEEGSVTFIIHSPYVGVDAWLDSACLRSTQADMLAVYAKTTNPGQWKRIYAAAGTGTVRVHNT